MLSILSNINADYILQIIAKDTPVVPSVGYGNIWGPLLDNNSILNKYNPRVVIFLIDIEDLVCDSISLQDSLGKINQWFNQMENVIVSDVEYFVSDVCFRTETIEDNDCLENSTIESYWNEKLLNSVKEHKNIHILKLRSKIESIGKESFFSSKLWYMGKIPYTNKGNKIVAETIIDSIKIINRINKKVLVLDLDNTLWGGILGEKGPNGIDLSDDHVGAIYKTVQRKIKKMKQLGVMLGVCSKNNLTDVLEVWKFNTHMLLQHDDFVSLKIDWNDKADNIIQMAKELNVGLDSFVFIDDMPNERENIKLRVPGVIVPDFPQKIDDYPDFFDKIFIKYFQRIHSTDEDLVKTQQYLENTKREESSKGLSYEEFIKSLCLRVNRIELNEQRLERIVQLIGKTNQFNLTTKRYSRQDINKMLESGYKLYAYNINDRFGDYGLVAVVIINTQSATIDSFIMSCRVMGKLVENCIIDRIENELLSLGITKLNSVYIKTQKNSPVEYLYDNLGYTIVEQNTIGKKYYIDLKNKPKREYYVEE